MIGYAKFGVKGKKCCKKTYVAYKILFTSSLY
uniref:Uncharacterized protein n=1 Tax=Anguilla anguilla TaxID=7936 RepID=A0A0E9RGF0_ANGAN